MPFTIKIRYSDRLIRRLEQRGAMYEPVAQAMLEHMQEAVVNARNICPVLSGRLQASIAILEFDPEVPTITGGVGRMPVGVKPPRPDKAGWRWESEGVMKARGALGTYNYSTDEMLVSRELKGFFDVDPESAKKCTDWIVAHEMGHRKDPLGRGLPSPEREERANRYAEEKTGIPREDFIAMYQGLRLKEIAGVKASKFRELAKQIARQAIDAGEPVSYAKYVEFGTRNMAARPFWRPAVWEAFFRLLDRFRRINRGEGVD